MVIFILETYDEDALIAYPGFNVHYPELNDKYREFNCPPIRREHLLENFLESLRRRPRTPSSDLSEFRQSLENKGWLIINCNTFVFLTLLAIILSSGLSDLERERQRILLELQALAGDSVEPEEGKLCLCICVHFYSCYFAHFNFRRELV